MAMKAGATGPVISALIDANFDISAIDTLTLTRAEAEDFVLEGLDCFCSHLGKQTGSAENATKLAHLFNVTSERMVHLLDERSPSLTTTKSNLKIGRVALKKAPMTKSLQSNLNDLNRRPYYLTRPASRLLEFIGMCIKKKEPVLIVGETGVGKTSAIQYLANSTNHQLVAVNLNQQTESCDLIGGIKPVNVEHYLMPVYADFEKAFSETFDTKCSKCQLHNKRGSHSFTIFCTKWTFQNYGNASFK